MPNFKLLFVDDEADFVSTIEEFFTGQGYTVFTAANGQQGLLRLKEHLPDAVFLDISMPHMDGRETLRVIRHLDPRIKVIIVSGYASEALACELLDGGAYGFRNPSTSCNSSRPSSALRCSRNWPIPEQDESVFCTRSTGSAENS